MDSCEEKRALQHKGLLILAKEGLCIQAKHEQTKQHGGFGWDKDEIRYSIPMALMNVVG